MVGLCSRLCSFSCPPSLPQAILLTCGCMLFYLHAFLKTRGVLCAFLFIFIDFIGLEISFCYLIFYSSSLQDLPILLCVWGWVSQEIDSEVEISMKEVYCGCSVFRINAWERRRDSGWEREWAEGETDLVGRSGAGWLCWVALTDGQGSRLKASTLMGRGLPWKCDWGDGGWLWLRAIFREGSR